jgi:hypothetical protein
MKLQITDQGLMWVETREEMVIDIQFTWAALWAAICRIGDWFMSLFTTTTGYQPQVQPLPPLCRIDPGAN